jgi:PAS domain S-box-containing protein
MAAGNGTRILVVDDNPAGRYAAARTLRAAGFTVDEASNGAQTLSQLAAQPELVVLDVNLPDINGVELCRQIKDNPATANILVLQLSATAVDLEHRLRGLAAGADSYVVQPVEPVELVAQVRALLRLRQAERQVRAAAREWHTTFRAISDGVVILDPEGRVLRGNSGLSRCLGLELPDLLGRPLEAALPPAPEGQAGPVQRALRGRQRVAVEMQLAGGWCRVTVDPLVDDGGALQGAVGVLADITRHKQVEADLEQRVQARTNELERSREELRLMAGRREAAREEERGRIAREIHDELGGALTGLKMDLARLRRQAGEQGAQPALLERFVELAGAIDAAVATVRRIATELRPPLLDDLGLVAALAWQLEEFQMRSGIASRLRTPVEQVNLSRPAAAALFRVVQEALTNVARHAQATRVTVRLAVQADRLELEVRDNGRGITPEDMSGGRALGLVGMRERVHMLAGTLDIQGKPGKGTSVLVRLPLEAHANRA